MMRWLDYELLRGCGWWDAGRMTTSPVTDLAAAIRSKLADEFENEACYGGCGTEDCRCSVSGFDEMKAALLAVLKTHTRWEVGHPDEPDYVCGTCRYFTSEWPCPTVDDIATALGVDCG